jgi:predicted Zn-dependent protease
MELNRLKSPCAILAALPWALFAEPPAALAHLGVHEEIEEVTRRIERSPERAELYLKRGELHRLHGEWALAAADYTRARMLDEELAAVDYCYGRMLLEAGMPGMAVVALDHYLAKRPRDARALVTRARAWSRLGRHRWAADDHAAAIAGQAAPRPEHFLERARALTAAGDAYIEEALAGIDAGIARLGNVVSLQVHAVELELRLERWDAALERLETLARGAARKESWLAQKGRVLKAAGRKEEARRAYGEALAAIGAVPVRRRGTRALARLEAEVRAALERLEGVGDGTAADSGSFRSRHPTHSMHCEAQPGMS